MKICYVDEAGCTGALPSATSNIQPVTIFSGVVIDHERLHVVTESFLALKHRFFPNLFSTDRRYFLTGILSEIKGADLRSGVAFGNRNQRRHVFGFLDGVFRILEENAAILVGRAWIKGIGVPIDGRAVYTYSIQSICAALQAYLRVIDDLGIVILDSRRQSQNAQVAHSVFTQKFRMQGDAYDRIVDLPAFADSTNHAGIQISDLIASALLFPMATHSYCSGIISSAHTQPRYELIKARYGRRLMALQFRYLEPSGKTSGGIIVSDTLTQRPGRHLFE